MDPAGNARTFLSAPVSARLLLTIQSAALALASEEGRADNAGRTNEGAKVRHL